MGDQKRIIVERGHRAHENSPMSESANKSRNGTEFISGPPTNITRMQNALSVDRRSTIRGADDEGECSGPTREYSFYQGCDFPKEFYVMMFLRLLSKSNYRDDYRKFR